MPQQEYVELSIAVKDYDKGEYPQPCFLLSGKDIDHSLLIFIGELGGVVCGQIVRSEILKPPPIHIVTNNIITGMGGKISSVIIIDVEIAGRGKNSILNFLSKIIITKRGGKKVEVEMRAGDALILAFYKNLPILVDPTVFEKIKN